MITARMLESNTCAACSAKWMMPSRASWRATASRRRAEALPVPALPRAFVERASAEAAATSVENVGRLGRAAARDAGDAVDSSPARSADARSSTRFTLPSSIRAAMRASDVRSTSMTRLIFSALVKRLLSAISVKPPYAAASIRNTYAGQFGRSTTRQSPGFAPWDCKLRAMAADSIRVSRYENDSSAPASSTYVKHVRCGHCRTMLSNAPIIAALRPASQALRRWPQRPGTIIAPGARTPPHARIHHLRETSGTE